MYKVLIVDDDPAIVSGVKQMAPWEEYGMDIPDTALNGKEAWEFIVEHGADILITDIKMPLLGGLELIRKIRETGWDTRFIILSGYDDFDFLKESIKLGIENYLLKPVNAQELMATLVNTLDKIQMNRTRQIDFSKDIQIIRNNILYRWMTNTIDEDELNERFYLLGVEPAATSYAVCILRVLADGGAGTNSHTLIPEIEKICGEIVLKYDSGQAFASPEGEIVFLFTDAPGRNVGSLLPTILEECRLAVKRSWELPLFITGGGFENSRRLVNRSYRRAKELQHYSLIFPPDSILDHPPKEAAVKVPMRQIVSRNEITRLAASKDLETLLTYIEEIFNQIKGMEGVTPSMAPNVATEILIAVIEGGLTAGGKNSLLYELGCPISDIYTLQSLNEVIRFTKDTTTRVIHYLAQSYERINPVIKRVIAYIKANYTEDISLKTLAVRFNVNANYLGRLFKEELGEFFLDYVNKTRVDKAKELLVKTNQSIREVSLLVGYADPNYFYTLFKKYTGVSPAEYRNQ
ncbi:MAG TPA: response regulator transcription factor [Bacillota bacterium]|nr:response regulator transcription factor [Bacillota bacterium]